MFANSNEICPQKQLFKRCCLTKGIKNVGTFSNNNKSIKGVSYKVTEQNAIPQFDKIIDLKMTFRLNRKLTGFEFSNNSKSILEHSIGIKK